MYIDNMDNLDTHFVSSVENAVQKSLRENKALLVYTSDGDNVWFESWFTPLVAEQLKDKCVWLRLLAQSREMSYFEEIFPGVKVPSVYCISKGQIVEMISYDQVDMDKFSTRLIRAVTNGKLVDISSEDSSEGSGTSRGTDLGSSGSPVGSSSSGPASTTTKLTEYQIRAKKHQLTEQQERERIMRLMKADREEMKHRRHSSCSSPGLISQDQELPIVLEVASEPIHDNIKNRDIINSTVCTLLIRLTDGKTLKHDFSSTETLNDVRKWVDANRTDKDLPYQFHRNIPRETFTESQEMSTLLDLELTPRSALILKPLENQGHSQKIADVEGPGLLGKLYQNVTSWWYKGSSTSGNTKRSQLPQENRDAVQSEASSRYVSPLSSPNITHTDPSRGVSPSPINYAHHSDDNNS